MKKIFFLLIFFSLFFVPAFARASISYSIYAQVNWESETCRTDYDLFVRTPTEGTCSPSSGTCETYDAHMGCTANYPGPETFYRTSSFEGAWSFFYTMWCPACTPGGQPSCPEECTGTPDPVFAEVTIYAYTDILVNSTYMVLAGESISIPIDYVPLDSDLFGTIVWVSDPQLPSPSPSPSPSSYCANGMPYTPPSQGCCGDPISTFSTIYNTATEGCCSNNTDLIGMTYPLATKACCGDPASGPAIIYNKAGPESCCTAIGDKGPIDNIGKFPKLYEKKKRETCCVVDDNTAPNKCDGCHKCVTANKSYVNVYAPECKGWGERICVPVGSKTDVSKGQCIDNCQDCTRCSDASKVTDGTGGTIDRQPNLPPALGGGKQTEGFFCQNLTEILTDEHYSKFPADQPPPNKGNTSYICQCAGNLSRCDASGSSKGGCFQYDETGYGYPPQPQYLAAGVADNHCPITNTQPAKVRGSCWCMGGARCGIGRKDANGRDIYVCADAGKSCAETKKVLPGPITVDYRLSSAGWTYDCGAKDCCVIDNATANYCAGPWNMFCIHGKAPAQGANVKYCKDTSECQPKREEDGGGGGGPVPGTGCDNSGKCVVGGAGNKCDIANGNDDCIPQKYCTEAKQCNTSGTHGVCDEAGDCNLTACTDDKKCETNGTGRPCDLVNGDAECGDQPTCTERETCEVDAVDGGHGTCPSVDSVGDDRCQKDTKCEGQRCITNGTGDPCDLANGDADCINQLGCTSEKKCDFGGDRGYCTSPDSVGDAWCEPPVASTFCNASNQCTEGGTGNYCESAADCQPLACNQNRQCVPFGGGAGCTIYTLNASAECQGPLQCDDVAKKCVPDGGGVACTNDTQCGGNNPPLAYNLRVEQSYCGAITTFRWDYSDAEGEPQYQYQLQMSTINDDPSTPVDEFKDGLVYNTGVVLGTTNSIIVPVYLASIRSPGECNLSQPCNGFINYNVPYYWRVKVWDIDGVSGFPVASDWAYYQDTHTFDPPNNYNKDGYPTYADDKDGDEYTYTYPYEHPHPGVSYEPQAIIVPGQPATFTDSSLCYHYDTDTGNTTSYPCKNLIPPGSPSTDCKVPGGVCYECTAATDGHCYTWWLNGLASPSSYIIGNTSYQYPSKDTYQTKLKICDDIMCCSAQNPVNVSANSGSVVPQWWEITPYNQ